MTSNFIYNDEAIGDEARITLTKLRVVDDAGTQHLEAVVDIDSLLTAFPSDSTDLAEAGIAPVLNIRPEHVLVSRKRDGTSVQREGTMEIKAGKQRQKVERWANQLVNEHLPWEQRDPEARRGAVLGNLSIRLDPKYIEDGTAVLIDRDGNPLDLDDLEVVQEVDLELHKGAQFDTAVDSLSRLKAAYQANRAMPGCLRGRRTSVRIWLVDDENASAVAHAYNQEGDPVNATAAKYRHQASPAQKLARMLVDRSTHLGAKNVEVLAKSPSKNSPKLASFNTISLAIENNWIHVPFDPEDDAIEAQVDWLVQAWDELVKVRPEFGYTGLRKRQEWRQSSVAGTAVSVHGMVAVFASIYPTTDFSILSKLRTTVPVLDSDGNPVLDLAGEPVSTDFFGIDNPLWLKEGILNYGKRGLIPQVSFQSRRTMATVLRQHLGL